MQNQLDTVSRSGMASSLTTGEASSILTAGQERGCRLGLDVGGTFERTGKYSLGALGVSHIASP